MNRGQRKLKHFTTASEIKSYQKHLRKHKPQEMITQYAYVTNSFMTSECKNLVWQKQDLLSQSLECYMSCVVLVTFARERKELNRLSFAWNCSWLFFYESYKFNFQRVVCKQRNWQWIYTFVYTFFVSVTQSGLVRIFKTMHRWKDLSLLKLLLTNLLTSSESQMGPGRTVCICIVPYGSYTTVAALKGLSSVQTYGRNNSKHWWEFLANNVVAVCTELRVKR